MAAQAKPEIFKAYDIRGVYGDDLDPEIAHLIGRAFARVIAATEGKETSELTLGLGRDMRLTAPEMAAAYRDGMIAEGASVLDAGEIGTEMLYFLVGSRDLDGGLMCTASHNPKRYTGAKLVGRGALALSGDAGIADVRDRIAAGLGDPAATPGSVTDLDIYSEFQEGARSFIDDGAIKPLKVVVDGDFLTALMSESMLAKNPGATVLFDVRASRAVADTAARVGGHALINRVGHAFFKQRMREVPDAVFGGEVSGHYYFRDFYSADSGTLPALLILELLSQREQSMSQLLEPYRSQYFISGEINSEVSDQAGKLAEIAERYADGRRTDLDGISIDYDDWHFNVRSSNTEPLLRLCLESLRSPEHMAAKRDELLGLIRS